jgi:hypothetical protein
MNTSSLSMPRNGVPRAIDADRAAGQAGVLMSSSDLPVASHALTQAG